MHTVVLWYGYHLFFLFTCLVTGDTKNIMEQVWADQPVCILGIATLIPRLSAWLISHQPIVLFSQNKPAINNQPAKLFSQNKSAPDISHQPNEQAAHIQRFAHMCMCAL
jgi:hypothetical protein